jgi:DNA-binding response OmpR family regulator
MGEGDRSLAGKKVLVVDDDRDIRTSIEAALEDLGPEVLLAADGNEALELAETNQPDLIVLDMMLPKRSGFLVMEKLRRGKKPSDPPRVIMITGNQGMRHKDYAESLGVDRYLNKPFPMERLIEAIRKLLS